MSQGPAQAALHQRIKALVGTRSMREVGALTGTPTETARRYVQGQAPSVEFLQALCDRLQVNPAWLLHGDGPVSKSDLRAQALREANPTELLTHVALTLEALIERVDRLEVFLQTMEARLRARVSPDHAGVHTEWKVGIGQEDGHGGAKGSGVPVSDSRSESIGDAISGRPRADAGGASPTGGS